MAAPIEPEVDLAASYAHRVDSLATHGEPEDALKILQDLADQFLPERHPLRLKVRALAGRLAMLNTEIADFGRTPELRAERNGILPPILALNIEVYAECRGGREPAPRTAPPPPMQLEADAPPASPQDRNRRVGDRSESHEQQPTQSADETLKLLVQESIRTAPELEEARSLFFSRMRQTQRDDPDAAVAFRCENVRKQFKWSSRTFELKSISLELVDGEIVGLIGANASGKTTLLEIIAGRLKADGGKIAYPSLERAGGGRAGILQQIAYVPQNVPRWNGNVVDNLHLWASLHGTTGRENVDEVEWILHRLDLTNYRDAQWNQLSGGYRMRFALARSLLSRPKLMILDEPLAHLDIITQQVFLRDLKAIALSAKRPLPIIMSSQHLYETESIADRILFLEDGKPVFQGSLQSLSDRRESNVIELSCNLTRTALLDRLKGLGAVRVEQLGLQYLVTLPLSVNADRVLKAVSDPRASIRYFRDISGSTVNLFRSRTLARDTDPQQRREPPGHGEGGGVQGGPLPQNPSTGRHLSLENG
jgi:ABC-2 type transport system ATP-binding protein